MAVRLSELVAEIGGSCVSPSAEDPLLEALAPLARATRTELAFMTSPKYLPQLTLTRAGAVIVKPTQAGAAHELREDLTLWLHDQPYLAYARASQHFHRQHHLASRPLVHPSVVLGHNVHCADNVSIGAGCVIGDDVVIGQGSVLHPNVTVYSGSRIGRRCLIHAGAVIGADGFGFALDGARWEKIIQTGRVILGDDVEVGANTTIDRGALDDTIIATGVKLDNQIQVGHNVVIGEHTAIAGCVGIAGSTRIGARCTIGGAAMIFGHLEIADDVHVSGATVVSKSLKRPGRYTGYFPIDEHRGWERNAATLRQLAELRRRIQALEALMTTHNLPEESS